MTEFAQLNDSNIVLQVIVIADSNAPDEATGIAFCKSLVGSDTTWLQTTLDRSFRGAHGGIGDWYDADNDQFVAPKPVERASWTYDYTTYAWEPPIPYPSDSVEKHLKDGKEIDGGKLGDKAAKDGDKTFIGEYRKVIGGPFTFYSWDENAYQADNSQGWVATGDVLNNTPDDWTNPDG